MTPEISNGLFLEMLLAALGGIASIAAAAVFIIKSFRRTPPAHEELEKLRAEIAMHYTPLGRVIDLEKQVRDEVVRIREERDKLTVSVQNSFLDVQRTLGQFEGQLKVEKKHD